MPESPAYLLSLNDLVSRTVLCPLAVSRPLAVSFIWLACLRRLLPLEVSLIVSRVAPRFAKLERPTATMIGLRDATRAPLGTRYHETAS